MVIVETDDATPPHFGFSFGRRSQHLDNRVRICAFCVIGDAIEKYRDTGLVDFRFKLRHSYTSLDEPPLRSVFILRKHSGFGERSGRLTASS
jgi:hypothetical protein